LTVVYKGQLRTDQVLPFFKDLQNPRIASAFAIVHSRFSTNTFPNWRLAQPFRYLSHNGEINTIRGNLNKMKSKEALMKSSFFSPEELAMLMPITNKLNSDSANLDAMVELLTLSGRSLPHAMMMLVPEAWQDNEVMDKERAAFYKFHASLVEPWDGPAALLFTDGKSVGATLDRNGLRPLRYFITKDQRLILSSEAEHSQSGKLRSPKKEESALDVCYGQTWKKERSSSTMKSKGRFADDSPTNNGSMKSEPNSGLCLSPKNLAIPTKQPKFMNAKLFLATPLRSLK